MTTLPEPKAHPQERPHRTDAVTIWIVSHEEFASSWRVYRGLRTTRDIERELAREGRAGRRAHVEIETLSCSPVEMSVEDLCALAVLS
jgi:hypothetical protein